LNKFLDNYKTTIEEEDFNFDIQFEGDDHV